MKNKGIKFFTKAIASALAAAFILTAMPTNSLSVKAATKVEISETAPAVNRKGEVIYKDTGNKMVTITPGSFARNVLSVTINDSYAKIKNIKCAKKLKYKLSRKEYDDKNDSVIYRFSFYTKNTPKRLFNFKFTVDGQQYSVFVNATSPVEKATFGNQLLSTKSGLGSSNYVTDMSKGKIKVKMGNGYSLESIQVGKYKNSTTKDGKTEPVLYWTQIKNNKKVILSNERQVIDTDGHDITEESMYSTTIIRVNYKYQKNGTTGCVDYYFNRIVDADN